MINTTIGKYKITRLIGEGGMASVYEAEHEMLGTKVAIKVLNPILSANAQIKERFRNEAKLMASLDHPNITKVIDFDEQPQQLSIVMEYLNGEDLNQKIKRNGPLSEKQITEVFSQTLSAFQYAHEKGIVHRDIKPSNIFILPNGYVKILDFGIAKLFGQGNEMTQTGTQMGTPTYMSPEQVKADKSIDHRSDIYSLGVTMFYAINGKPPYNSNTDSQFDIFTKIVYEPLPEMPNSGIFNEFIKKACQKDRQQRFQTCQEWLNKLNNPVPSGANATTDKNKTVIANTSHNDATKVQQQAKDTTTASTQTPQEPKVNKTEKSKSYRWLFILIIPIAMYFKYSISDNSSADTAEDIAANANTVAEVFPEVSIGTQVWMDKNLDISTFRNGDLIPQAKTDEEWKKAGETQQPAWCYYDNDPANGQKYGKLYNWYAVNDARGLAPKGYHIPTHAEWTILTDYLGGKEVAGTKMKSTSGWNENGNGSNESGFNGLPGGFRSYNGTFYFIGENGDWWSSTENSTSNAWTHYLYCSSGDVSSDYGLKGDGFAVRCLRD